MQVKLILLYQIILFKKLKKILIKIIVKFL